MFDVDNETGEINADNTTATKQTKKSPEKETKLYLEALTDCLINVRGVGKFNKKGQSFPVTKELAECFKADDKFFKIINKEV